MQIWQPNNTHCLLRLSSFTHFTNAASTRKQHLWCQIAFLYRRNASIVQSGVFFFLYFLHTKRGRKCRSWLMWCLRFWVITDGGWRFSNNYYSFCFAAPEVHSHNMICVLHRGVTLVTELSRSDPVRFGWKTAGEYNVYSRFTWNDKQIEFIRCSMSGRKNCCPSERSIIVRLKLWWALRLNELYRRVKYLFVVEDKINLSDLFGLD